MFIAWSPSGLSLFGQLPVAPFDFYQNHSAIIEAVVILR
jgi:hypothetical protein